MSHNAIVIKTMQTWLATIETDETSAASISTIVCYYFQS